MTEFGAGPPERDPALAAAEARLLTDFRLAFFFAQGEQNRLPRRDNPRLELILCFLGYEYGRIMDDDFIYAWPSLLPSLGEKALSLQLPAEHVSVSEGMRRAQLQDGWRVFEAVLQYHSTPYDKYSWDDYLRHMTKIC